jgi:hypothetical protein
MAAALDQIVDERGSPKKHETAAGTPILQPTDERRRTGSHYTPRSLTEPIVRHALEPAFERLGPSATPEQILDLKVCDPAMGSGAFLVEACRALAARLVEAWARHPEKKPKIPPDEDEELHARRLVAQRCLYGVDKNPLATDLAKLSLWLATLARDHEFTFLDHALKSGDSLVGLTQAQIAAAHWDTSKPGLPLFRQLVKDRVAEAMRGRAQIQAAPDDTARAIQEARYKSLEARLRDIRLMGDAVIAAFFAADKPRARETKRAEVESWLTGSMEAAWDRLAGMAATLKQGAHPLTPFHWEIEFPEVFVRENGGFDAVVGNPPYLGVTAFDQSNREGYTDWVRSANPNSGGKCDLIAFFARRANDITRVRGCIGILATNTIAQGDTRESGLLQIVKLGSTISRAIRRIVWPGEASVHATAIHIRKSFKSDRSFLDGKPVDFISSYLSSKVPDVPPSDLASNKGACTKGVVHYGEAFYVSASVEEPPDGVGADEWSNFLRSNSRWAIGGDQLNNLLRFDEWRRLIDLNRFSSEDALSQAGLLQIAERRLKLQRQNLGNVSGAERLRRHWWQFQFSPLIALEQAPKLGLARLTKHFAWRVIPEHVIPTEQVIILRYQDHAQFATLESRPHELWARFFASSMKDDLRYTPSDCFETFPFPSDFETSSDVEDAGQAYYDHRAALMVARNEGMTKIYNRFHDRSETSPDIQRLRELHAAMDRAVLEAYGWHDLAARAHFPRRDQRG